MAVGASTPAAATASDAAVAEGGGRSPVVGRLSLFDFSLSRSEVCMSGGYQMEVDWVWVSSERRTRLQVWCGFVGTRTAVGKPTSTAPVIGVDERERKSRGYGCACVVC
ncbi:hypothetical protein HanRHA438_Chr07g0298001 [Helianthus annuus]|nr:hypothetical protein HanRHA438_Chr07g0298001 [Helianthus annuus]